MVGLSKFRMAIIIIENVSFAGRVMNKRKIDINQLKKTSIKGKKYRTINVKYQTVLAYFKQKQPKDNQIFKVSFPALVNDLLHQISALQLVYKIQNQSEQPLKLIEIQGQQFKLDAFGFKRFSSEYPIAELAECLYVEKDQQTGQQSLNISRNKLMHFFKNLRRIYSEFCYCVGDKYILESYQYKSLYENFQFEWGKIEEKGKHSSLEKLTKKICRSLYFLGVLIENNIFMTIDNRQRRKREDASQVGTRSDYQRNFKVVKQQVSSTYSFGSTELISNRNFSNLSFRLKSQKSNDDDFMARNEYSQKSEKIVRRRMRTQSFLFNKLEMKNLKIRVAPMQKKEQEVLQNRQYEIDLLGNDVENILIEQAFKLQKWQDSCQRYEYGQNPYYYMNMGMNMNMNMNMGMGGMGGMQSMNMMNPMNSPNGMGNINYMQPVAYECFEMTPQNPQDLHQLRRSFDFYNLVDTKKALPRMQSKQYD